MVVRSSEATRPSGGREQPDGESDDLREREADARAVGELYTTDTAGRRHTFAGHLRGLVRIPPRQ